MKQPRGFTLIELMVVIMIIGVLSALLIGISSTTYGASSANVADDVVQEFNLCKMRAVSTRHWHRCEIDGTVSPPTLTVYQWPSAGMTVPTSGSTAWQNVYAISIGPNVSVWDASATVCASSPCGGAPTAPNTSLKFDFDFRPDGSSTGGTAYISDAGHNKVERVVVYTATGSSYARNSW